MMKKDRVFKCCRCLKSFRSKGNSNNLFCSRQCAFAFPHEAGIKNVGFCRVRSEQFTISWCACGELVVNGAMCQSCLEPLVRKRKEKHLLISRHRELERLYRRRTGKARGTCKDCGVVVPVGIGEHVKQRCAGCHAKHDREQRHKMRAAREARKKAAFVEQVWRKEVFERDGWRCQLCGRKTPKHLLGTSDMRAPTLDHIKPLAKGGKHSYDNTQCACFYCNAIKSDSAGCQLRLWGIVKPGGTRILANGA